MGKPKLKSSIKALQQSLFNFRPPGTKTISWVCIQEAKTHSFREVYNSYNSIYSSSSSTSSDLISLNQEIEHLIDDHMVSIQEEPSFLSSTSSSSSSSATYSDDSNAAELVPKGVISTQRFFFSPCTTKSIMGGGGADIHTSEDDEIEMGLTKKVVSVDGEFETEEIVELGDEDCLIMEMGLGKEMVRTMAMSSENPYLDFRVSMEEMVVSHGLREWSCLQDLLHCYLRLNDRLTHKTIVMAFVDLLVQIISEETNINNSNNKESFCPYPFRFPLCLAE